jgi:ribosomal protein S18 acetylase RimI-like enzyme
VPERTEFHVAPVRSAGDLAAVVRLFESYAASLGIDLAYQDFAGELAAMPGKYAPPGGELLLARRPEGEALGCVGLRPLRSPEVCEIKRLYVAPAARGMGLGRALLNAVLRAAARIGYREVWLDTLPSMTEATALYRAVGFRPIAPYYATPIAGTLFMGRKLVPNSDGA